MRWVSNFKSVNYYFLVLGWFCYFSLHSILASNKIKNKFPARPFRIFYTLIAVSGLLALLFLTGSMKGDLFFTSKGPVRYVSLILTTFGVMIIQSSFRQYSLRGFVGLSDEKKELRTDGILKFIRHPIYAGTILIVMGFFFFIPNLPTLISCICMLAYIPIGIYLEEKKLLSTFGEGYLEYRKKVPAIIPFLKRREAT